MAQVKHKPGKSDTPIYRSPVRWLIGMLAGAAIGAGLEWVINGHVALGMGLGVLLGGVLAVTMNSSLQRRVAQAPDTRGKPPPR